MISFNGFGDRLSAAMKKQNITNTQITEELGLSKNAIGNYKNDNIPRADILYAISQKIGVSMEWLLTGKEDYTELTEEEKQLLEDFRNCSLETRKVVRAAAASGAEGKQEPTSSTLKIG